MLDVITVGFERPWTMALLLFLTVSGTAVFGAAMGTWRGGMMPTFAAAKLPLAMLTTGGVAVLVNCGVARILGLRIACRQSLRLTVVAMASTSALLLLAAPVVWWLCRALPAAGMAPDRVHGVLCTVGIVLAAGAGAAGAAVLWQALGRFGRCPMLRKRVFVAWLLVFAAVGVQMTWSLRPFVGTSDRPIEFLRTGLDDGAPAAWAQAGR